MALADFRFLSSVLPYRSKTRSDYACGPLQEQVKGGIGDSTAVELPSIVYDDCPVGPPALPVIDGPADVQDHCNGKAQSHQYPDEE
jgi:hypothetical protein